MNSEAPADDSYDAFRNAREAMSDVITHVLDEEGIEAFSEMQASYFDLVAGEKARDPEFQAVNMAGTRLNIPNSNRVFEKQSVDDKYGEVIAPTKYDEFRVLDDFTVCDPKNPTTTHGVTVDHAITPDGDVRCEVNGVSLDDVGQKIGSYIR